MRWSATAAAWEIATKFRLGRLLGVSATAAGLGCVLLPCTASGPAHCRTATRPARSHADCSSRARRHGAGAAHDDMVLAPRTTTWCWRRALKGQAAEMGGLRTFRAMSRSLRKYFGRCGYALRIPSFVFV
jgi:hypothetical protein